MANQLFGTVFFNDFLTGKGLGFNIRGGKDSPYIPGDPSIYVTRIDSDGMAAKDGRLSVGDKLIEVNRMVVDDRQINFRVTNNEFFSNFILPYKSKHRPMSIERKRISIWTRFLDDFFKNFKMLFAVDPHR